MANNYAIIVSGGSGTRMQSKVPKQFMLLDGLPILMHTVRAFANNQAKPTVILVLNKLYKEDWDNLCKEYAFDTPYKVVYGGATRFDSVKKGLNYLYDSFKDINHSHIAIHDGVRPLVSQQLITDGYTQLANHQALVSAIPSKDSIRIIDNNEKEASTAVDRSTVFLVQTPQFFSGEVLLKAYEQEYNERFTDDASVVENAGYPIRVIPGDHRNIKITFSEDLLLAEALIRS
ncbi:2-C-methyl-D-erythritol 4-phosphate cytidylyltransferase [Olivibacter domesticus]|uniref:2-C-methyl-D-erythritol 4-phosphate cytidylyltransferase n=1 Tax=Olivibacter domesticus TaxID=407022 RepID=A0A1H7LJ82_OLID1|nr:2-C-methyl-D-erythritol 4-phosphate cytidylyltransferase [Olivibacter domesticus]SEK99032.1 2-C-methyl-D-erythritol 4-phosphate cytidylyltransferase [Olivibacter domesticus]